MKKISIILYLISSFSVNAESLYHSFITNSNNEQNTLIISIIKSTSYERKISICSILGTRDDNDFNSILSYLIYEHEKKENAYLLALFIEGLRSKTDKSIKNAIKINFEYFKVLIDSIKQSSENELIIQMLQLVQFFQEKDANAIILNSGNKILEVFINKNGFTNNDLKLAFNYIEAAAKIDNKVIRQQIVQIYRLNRNKTLAKSIRDLFF